MMFNREFKARRDFFNSRIYKVPVVALQNVYGSKGVI